MELTEKKVLVVGLGKSGMSSSRWLSKVGAKVTVSDLKPESKLDRGMVEELLALGVRLETGGHREETFLEEDLIIVSPGVPLDMNALVFARMRGIPVWGEMDLAVRLIDTPIIAITGTNGKSTTTELLGSFLKEAGRRVFVGGNIGTPLMDYVAAGQKADYAVIEVSSFQLDTLAHFTPLIALILNISPDHLDRYADYEAYVQSKLRICRDQGSGQYAILNDDDERLSRYHPPEGVSILRYGEEKRHDRQAFLNGDHLFASLPGGDGQHFHWRRFQLPGRHNLENLMGSVLAALILGIKPDIIQGVMDHFPALPHRLMFVKRIGGVDFYDDSKATNVSAAVRSIMSFDRPIVLLAGGRHKGGDYSPLVVASRGRVKKAVFLGEAGGLLAESFDHVIPYSMAGDMVDAVTQAYGAAGHDDVVLLAPACSSFDMFSDYAHRGRVFREAVERLDDGR